MMLADSDWEKQMMQSDGVADVSSDELKAPYERPLLYCLGDVRELTLGRSRGVVAGECPSHE